MLYLTADQAPVRTGADWKCAEGSSLSFNSFVNSFYLSFWRDHTSAGRIGIRLRGSGTVTVRVWHAVANEGDTLVMTDQVALGNGIGAVLWPPEAGSIGRLYLVVDCMTECRMDEIAFVTDAPPSQDVRLSLGLCTYNREAQIGATIRTLADARPGLPGLSDVFVVNQGTGFSDQILLKDLERLGAQVHEQANLGGAGGFSRSLREALLAVPAPTFHLLMDDDIVLDPRVIRRLIDGLGYTAPDLLIGGSMLETERPTLLYEAGAKIQPLWNLTRVGEGSDMSDARSAALFDRSYEVDYNGWWFCAIPMAAVREVGLPLPIFIHGDDIEYGCRMQTAGHRTVVLPGAAVWHDAFSGKPRPWIVYYDFRNLLINSALYPGIAAPLRPIEVMGALFARLLCHQYDMGWALMRAVSDYLAGPERILGGDVPGLQDCQIGAISRDRLQTSEAATLDPKPIAGPSRPFPPGIWPVVALFLWRFVQISLSWPAATRLLIFTPEHVHPGVAGPGAFCVKTDPDGDTLAIYRPHRATLWLGSIRALAVSFRFLIGNRRAARDWAKNAPKYATETQWKKHFSAGEDGPAPQAD